MLAVRAARHRGRGVALGERRDGDERPREIGGEQAHCLTKLQHEPRVDDVLRRRAPVRPVARLAGPHGERPHEGHQRVLRRRDLGAQHVEVVELGTARGSDLLGLLGRDQRDVGEGSSECRLGIEPALQETLGVEDRAHPRGPEQVAQQRAVERARQAVSRQESR